MEALAAGMVVIVVLSVLAAASARSRRSEHAAPAGTVPPGTRQRREVTQIDLGVSIVEAQVIEQRLRAQGFTVSLLRNEHPETGAFSALGRAALLVLEDEESAVREELAGTGY